MTADAWLAIETGTVEGSVAAWVAGEVVFAESFTSDRSHNALIFGPLARALRVLGRRTPGAVLVGTGPGSYSGTRVGIAAAQGVAIARACPVIGVPSLLATPQALAGTASLAVGDARRGAWWIARIDAAGTTDGPQLCGADELAAAVRAAVAAGAPSVAFDPPDRFEMLENPGACLVIARPTARGLLEAWQRLGESARRELAARVPEPCYLRPPHVTRAKPGHPLFRAGQGGAARPD
jgi:tRNA threonylcarbamoyl adenosine modification protein YeaZ